MPGKGDDVGGSFFIITGDEHRLHGEGVVVIFFNTSSDFHTLLLFSVVF